MFFKSAIAAVTLGLMAVSANASTIDFSVYPTGSLGSNVLVTPYATFTTTDGIYLNEASSSDICAFNSSFSCQGVDMTIDFTSAVTNLSFVAFIHNDFDFVTVTAYNGLNVLGLVNISADGLVDLTG
jgi:hypothetical protein